MLFKINYCPRWKSQETHKHKKQSYCFLKHVQHVVNHWDLRRYKDGFQSIYVVQY
jgi:hypothetical protein